MMIEMEYICLTENLTVLGSLNDITVTLMKSIMKLVDTQYPYL